MNSFDLRKGFEMSLEFNRETRCKEVFNLKLKDLPKHLELLELEVIAKTELLDSIFNTLAEHNNRYQILLDKVEELESKMAFLKDGELLIERGVTLCRAKEEAKNKDKRC